MALAFSALAGGIVLLYILKLRRAKVPVSSILLWERAIHDSKANALWQKLRRNLLMILQIIALILLALALARPFVFGTALIGGRTVLLLDTSASMLATDESPDRLGAASEAASGLISDLSRNDEGMVIAAGPTPRILQSFTKNKSELLSAIRQARDEAGGVADLNAALRLISSIAAGSSTRVVIFSDGAVPDLDPFATTDLSISFYPVGKASDNLAIVGAGTRLSPFSDEYELFVALRNYYGVPKKLDLLLSVQDEVLDVMEAELGAGQRKELVFRNLPYIPGPISVSIDVQDPLSEDDEAHISMPERVRYKVALSTQGESVLLRKVLRSLRDVELYNYTGGSLDSADAGASASGAAGEMDVWVVEGDAPSVADSGASYLFIDTTRHAFLPVVPGEVARVDFAADPPVIPTVVGLERGHRVLRYVKISELHLQAMRRTTVQPWGRVLVDASEGPLIVEGNLDGQRSLYLAFNIYESDFPLRAAFPVFMANAISYLGQAREGAAGASTAAGSRVDMLAPAEAARVVITDPSGHKSTLELGSREFTLSRTNEAGVYGLGYFDEAGRELKRSFLPVSLVSAEESNIAPARTLIVKGVDEMLAGAGAPPEIVGTKEVRVNREFFTWLILAVLLIISAEWYLYHTRAL